MRHFRSVVLYTALAILANGGLAAAAGPDTPDLATLESLREGSLQKLVFVDAAEVAPDTVFTAPDGTEHQLSDWRGKHVLVNFWATWCAPCRKEMGALDRLEAALGGDRFAVVTIATGRNPLPAIEQFFAEEGIEHLPVLLDPKQALARNMAVMALPVSVILDPEGREIGRLMGDAEWDSESARAIIAALTGSAN